MHHLSTLAAIIGLTNPAMASCSQDNCYRSLEHHERTSSSGFCKTYLTTSPASAPNGIATCGPTRISSACSCLTITNDQPTITATTPSSLFNPSTCARESIAACPTPYHPCCAYICAEAQVPFQVCSPENETVLAQCSKCPSTTASSPNNKTKSSSTITSSPSTLSASTCTGRILTTTACPTPYDPCCAWNCEEAQVPFNVCSQTDGSGEFAVCTKCPSPTP